MTPFALRPYHAYQPSWRHRASLSRYLIGAGVWLAVIGLAVGIGTGLG